MSDEDLGRPLAPCSLNFTLAEISVTDVSGETIVIPGPNKEASGKKPLRNTNEVIKKITLKNFNNILSLSK